MLTSTLRRLVSRRVAPQKARFQAFAWDMLRIVKCRWMCRMARVFWPEGRASRWEMNFVRRVESWKESVLVE